MKSNAVIWLALLALAAPTSAQETKKPAPTPVPVHPACGSREHSVCIIVGSFSHLSHLPNPFALSFHH